MSDYTQPHHVLPPPPRKFAPEAAPAIRHYSLKARILASSLTLSLFAVSAGVWMSPALKIFPHGPSAEDIALESSQARANDLKRRLDQETARNEEPRPIAFDSVDRSRANDLERQVRELEDKLKLPHHRPVDGTQKARADDLARRLTELTALSERRRPPMVDESAVARANDLKAQNDALQAEITRPRPTPDPLANVTTPITKADILNGQDLFGMTTTQSPFDYGEVDLVQGLVQRKADIVGYFQSFQNNFNDLPIRNAWLHGQIPMMTWESQAQVGAVDTNQPAYSLGNIIGGNFDTYIRSYADGIRDLKLPVILRFDHEMNGTWYPWSEWSDSANVSINGNQKGQYAAAWRHVHDIFQAEGANAYTIWLWAPNRVNRICGQRAPAQFYPGDDAVDWIGMDGYFRNYLTAAGPCDDIAPTFDAVFGRTLPLLRAAAPSKPIFLAEVGAAEDGGHKVAWINDLFRGLAANPDIIGFDWFSLSVSSGAENDRVTHDWRINSSAESANAMRANLAAANVGTPLTG